jgi:hypothetical protein
MARELCLSNQSSSRRQLRPFCIELISTGTRLSVEGRPKQAFCQKCAGKLLRMSSSGRERIGANKRASVDRAGFSVGEGFVTGS